MEGILGEFAKLPADSALRLSYEKGLPTPKRS